MSKSLKPKKRTAAPPPRRRRSGWLMLALFALAAVAAISVGVWLVQRNQPAPVQTLSGESTPEEAVNGPRLAVDQENFDYGDVKLNTTIETEIKVKNVGDEVLALAPNPVVELVEGC